MDKGVLSGKPVTYPLHEHRSMWRTTINALDPKLANAYRPLMGNRITTLRYTNEE